jgi:uncharacterized protein HemX
MPAALPIMAITGAIGTGAGIVTGIKQEEERKKYAKKQKSLQEQKEAKLLAERKKKIDLMRSELLAPSLFGGRRSLQTGGEMGLTREVLG